MLHIRVFKSLGLYVTGSLGEAIRELPLRDEIQGRND